MNISTIGNAAAKKKVAGSRRMCTASLRATDAMRCNDAATDMVHSFWARLRFAGIQPRISRIASVKSVVYFGLLTIQVLHSSLFLRSGQRHEHILQARLGLADVEGFQAQGAC